MGRQQPVGDLQRSEHTRRPVRHIEGECAVTANGRVAEVGADVFLDERSEGRFTEIPIAVDAGVEQHVNIVRLYVRRP